MKIRIKNESVNSFLDRVHLSKKKIYELKINKKISFSSNDYDKVINEDVYFNLDEESIYKPVEGNLDIIYEDDFYLVVNKPRGIIIHDGNNSLANIVSFYYQLNNIHSEVRFPSRLDKDTIGVVIFAKNIISSAYLDELFRTDQVKKEYICLVKNKFKEKSGKVTYSISSDRHNNNKMVTSINGKPAKTLYKVLKNGDISYLSVVIKTGRTHQIRLHMSKIGHPVLGDKIYDNGVGVLMLECKKIEFKNFDGNDLVFEAKIDNEFNDVLKTL